MAFDASISTEFSLSRILDEMIIGNTDIEVIVSFLKSHENVLGDIFNKSSFVFELYDFESSYGIQMHPWLRSKIGYLGDCDLVYAVVERISWIRSNGGGYSEISDIRDNVRSRMDGIRLGKYVLTGFNGDENVLDGDITLVDWLNTTPSLDIDAFLKRSIFARSAMMYYNFRKLNPDVQLKIMMSLAAKFSDTEKYYREIDTIIKLECEMVGSYLKQCLMLGEVDDFDWGSSFFRIESNAMRMYSPVKLVFWEEEVNRLPKSLAEGIDKKSFVDLVFDYGMTDGNFDILDLFIYIYVCDGRLRNEMVEDCEFLENLELPFDWKELSVFKNQQKEVA